MIKLKEICAYLEQFAPAALAEDWDNVGLLAGDPELEMKRIMTCLTMTPRSVDEAVQGKADLVVTHHPLPFRPLKRVVTTTTPGRLLWNLITQGIAVYSPHTAFDSTAGGINQRLAEGLGLRDIRPLVPIDGAPEGVGGGRYGQLERPLLLSQVANVLCDFLGVERLQFVGNLSGTVERVAVACGAAGEFLAAAQQQRCDLLVLGETSFHTCLEAEATGVSLLLPGHFASERFAVERLAELLGAEFPTLHVWASGTEADPVQHYG